MQFQTVDVNAAGARCRTVLGRNVNVNGPNIKCKIILHTLSNLWSHSLSHLPLPQLPLWVYIQMLKMGQAFSFLVQTQHGKTNTCIHVCVCVCDDSIKVVFTLKQNLKQHVGHKTFSQFQLSLHELQKACTRLFLDTY